MSGGSLRRAVPVALFALVLYAPGARALRPFVGTDASTVDAGRVELELGPVGWVREDGEDSFAPSAVATAGVAPGWELSVSATPTWNLSSRADEVLGGETSGSPGSTCCARVRCRIVRVPASRWRRRC